MLNELRVKKYQNKIPELTRRVSTRHYEPRLFSSVRVENELYS
ncbi:MAG: hypothetical protein ACI8YQ_001209 [Polaribacter sp.]|jgi:hypothetical protein